VEEMQGLGQLWSMWRVVLLVGLRLRRFLVWACWRLRGVRYVVTLSFPLLLHVAEEVGYLTVDTFAWQNAGHVAQSAYVTIAYAMPVAVARRLIRCLL
jgi:hypothetical protein